MAASCWILAAMISNVTPPNVAPPLRVFTAVLASGAAAATHVSMLGMLRYYGRTGLAGWAAGTGAGGLFCAVFPYVLTVWTRSGLRDALDFSYLLIAATLLAFFVVLPSAPMNFPLTKSVGDKEDLEENVEAMSLLAQESIRELSLQLNAAKRVELIRRVLEPFIIPLVIVFAAQAVIYPGIARALPKTEAFNTFFAFSTAYGVIFQLGNFAARCFVPLFRVRGTSVLFTILGALTAFTVLNASFIIFSSFILVGLVVLCGGLLTGALYTVVVGRAVMDKAVESGVEKEFCLQVVGTGETVGVIVGGLVATMLEGQICQLAYGGTSRWCNFSR